VSSLWHVERQRTNGRWVGDSPSDSKGMQSSLHRQQRVYRRCTVSSPDAFVPPSFETARDAIESSSSCSIVKATVNSHSCLSLFTHKHYRPVGQLIISAAVIDDMIALIVLSMLKTLTATEITVAAILIPIVSALGFLFIGGYIAIFMAPRFLHRFVLDKVEERYHAKIELAIMFGLLLGLMPATYFAKASFLMGAFIAGLVFCSSHGLHSLFVSQFKRILAWLMRIFFAASIG